MSRITTIEEELLRDPVLYAPLTDEQAKDEFNATKVVLQSILTENIYGYLSLHSKLLPIEDSTLSECRDSMRALETLASFDITKTEVLDKLVEILDDIIGAAFLTETDKIAILDLGNKTTSTSIELGLVKVLTGEITRAREEE